MNELLIGILITAFVALSMISNEYISIIQKGRNPRPIADGQVTLVYRLCNLVVQGVTRNSVIRCCGVNKNVVIYQQSILSFLYFCGGMTKVDQDAGPVHTVNKG